MHVVLGMLFGGTCVAVFFEDPPYFLEPTGLSLEPGQVPPLLKLALGIMAPLVLWSGLADLVAARKLERKTP